MVTTAALKINVIGNSILVAFLLFVCGVAMWLTYSHIMTPPPVDAQASNIHGLFIVIGLLACMVLVVVTIFFIIHLFDYIQNYYASKTTKGVWD